VKNNHQSKLYDIQKMKPNILMLMETKEDMLTPNQMLTK